MKDSPRRAAEVEQVLVHEKLTSRIIGAAIRVHRSLGPGLLESAYEICLAHELISQGLLIQRQLILPVLYGASATVSCDEL